MTLKYLLILKVILSACAWCADISFKYGQCLCYATNKIMKPNKYPYSFIKSSCFSSLFNSEGRVEPWPRS